MVALVLLIAFYVYHKKYSSAERLAAVDEWEIDPRHLTLLEKIGEGFFGDVLKAEFSSNYLHLKLSSGIRREAGIEDNKFVAACKKLKGANVFLGYSLISLHAFVTFSLIITCVGAYLQQDEADFLEEIKLMKGIGRHPHIVCMLACVTKSQPFCLIVEYCSHGDLLNYLQKGRPQV